MPRVGTRPEEQSSGGGQFNVPEGNGEVVACTVVNHSIPGYDTDCGYNITVQPLDRNWAPTGAEPTTEFVKAGPVTKFHPGLAVSAADTYPEIGNDKDAGEQDGAEGTCLLSVTGAGPDKKAKLSIFSTAAIESGVKSELFDGYAPNLVGLQAHFTRFMMEKIPGSMAKQDPTVIIIGVGGKATGPANVHRYPAAQTSAQAANPAATSTSTSAPTPAPARTPRTAPGPATAPPASTSAASAPANGVDWVAMKRDLAGITDPAAIATSILSTLSTTHAGQVLPWPQRFTAVVVTAFVKSGVVDQAVKSGVQAKIKDREWFGQVSEDLGWKLDGAGNVQIPAVEG